MRRAVVGTFVGLWLPVTLAGQSPPPRTDPLKHLRLDRGGWVWLAVGGQLRARVESWRDFGFGAAANHDDDYALNRAFLGVDLHFGSTLRAYLEGRSAVLTDRNLPGGRRSVDADDLDLQNAYLELILRPGASSLVGRVGRQELLFGRQRLVSPLDWVNARRTFEGGRVTLTRRTWTLDAFAVHPVQVRKSAFNRWDATVGFFGLYGQRKAGRVPGVDLYWLVLDRDSARFNGTSGAERRHTLGTRIWGKGASGRVEYDLEVAYQRGHVGSETVSAAMGGSDLAYLAGRLPGSPRIHGGLDYASGDAQAGGDVGTFNQLFPLGHAFLGFIDVVGRQNVLAPNAGISVRPVAPVTLDGTVSYFARASLSDALYNAVGAVERPAGSATAKGVGTELDLTGTWRAGSRVVFVLGYSRLWPGDFIRQTGAAGTIRFGYGSLQMSY